MFSSFRTHAETRALNGAVLAGGGLGLVVSVFYLVSTQLSLSADEARVARLTDAAVAGYANHTADTVPAAASAPLAAMPTAPVRQAVAQRPAVSARELDCLATAVYYEARGETAAGQAAVAQVVLNRARHPAYPKSVCAVVFQSGGAHSCQFSFVCNGAMNHTREPGAWDKAREVAARALNGYVMTAVGQATAFHAASAGGVGAHGGAVQLGRQVFYNASSVHASRRAGEVRLADAGAGDRRGHGALVIANAPHLTFALGVLTPVAATPSKAAGLAPADNPGQSPVVSVASKAS